jgi:hypothetical protein
VGSGSRQAYQLASIVSSAAPSATMPGLTIGDTIPNLELDSTHGKIRIHDFIGDGYVIIFSHPGICYICSLSP